MKRAMPSDLNFLSIEIVNVAEIIL